MVSPFCLVMDDRTSLILNVVDKLQSTFVYSFAVLALFALYSRSRSTSKLFVNIGML